MNEFRRSPRILAQVPVQISGERPHGAHTVVVNRHGALILSPVNYTTDSEITLQNRNTGAVARAHVVWSGGADTTGLFKLGIELVDELPEFWAVDYEAALAAGRKPD